MLYFVLFILSFSSLYSQDSAFEEFIIRYENGEPINTEEISYPFTKGDSIFVKVKDDKGYTLGMLSTDRGVTWRDVYPTIYEGNKSFENAVEPHPISFEFLIVDSDDSTYFNYLDFNGNLIRKTTTKRTVKNYWKNPYNPKMLIDIVERSSGIYDTEIVDFSTDYGVTWYPLVQIASGYSNTAKFTFNIRNPNFIHAERYIYHPINNIAYRDAYLVDSEKLKKYEMINLNDHNYGSTDEYESISWDNVKNLYGIRKYLKEDNNELFDYIYNFDIVNKSFNDSLNNIDKNLFIDNININISSNYFEYDGLIDWTNFLGSFRFLSDNIFNPDEKVLSLRYSRIKKSDNSEVFNKKLIFYTNDNGKNWDMMGEYDYDFDSQHLNFVVVSDKSKNVYIVYRNKESPYEAVILKSKYTLLSAQQESNKTRNKVYFSNNNLIIENKEEIKESIVKIFDLGGRVIFNQKILLQKGTNQIPLTSQINPNLYLVNIEFKDSKVNIYKLIKGE
jgi:hypothetical protein